MESCIECHKKNCLIIDESEGNIVCTECGRVNTSNLIDDSAEWRHFEEHDGPDPCRVGLPNNELLQDKGICTLISDTYLKKWGQRSQLSTTDSALLKTFQELDHICHSLCLPAKVIEMSKKLFKTVYSTKQTKGKSHMGIVCSCIFITCRKLKNICNVSDIARECSVDKKKLVKAFEFVNVYSKKVFPFSKVEKIANEYAERMKVDQGWVEKVVNLVEEISEIRRYRAGEDEAVAILAVLVIEALKGRCRALEEYCTVSGVERYTIIEMYRELFKQRSTLLSGFGTNWEIANMPNF